MSPPDQADEALAALLSPVQLSAQRNMIAAMMVATIVSKSSFTGYFRPGALKCAFTMADELIFYGKAYPQGHFHDAQGHLK